MDFINRYFQAAEGKTDQLNITNQRVNNLNKFTSLLYINIVGGSHKRTESKGCNDQRYTGSRIELVSERAG